MQPAGVHGQYAPNYVNSLAVHPVGGRPSMFIGGAFDSAGNLPSSDIAEWHCPIRPGDVNGDGAVMVEDIVPFVTAALDPTAAAPAQFIAADVNTDCALNGLDIKPLLDLLL